MPAVKNVGEPCAGEPHARFDGGREETSDSRPCRATLGASRLPDQPPRSMSRRHSRGALDTGLSRRAAREATANRHLSLCSCFEARLSRKSALDAVAGKRLVRGEFSVGAATGGPPAVASGGREGRGGGA